MKLFLPDKMVKFSNITLLEILREKTIIAETFQTIFTNTVTNLKIPPYISGLET